MKSIATLVAVVLLATGSQAAIVQDAGATTKSDASTSAAATTTGSGGNYGSLISSLNAGKLADLSTFKASSTVTCVKLSSLSEASANKSALDNAMSKNATAVTDLKTAINANTEFKAKLDPTTCPVDKVIPVTEETGGSFVVYVDDRT